MSITVEHTIISFNDWIDWNDNQPKKDYGHQGTGFLDVATAHFLKDSFSGFMTAPVAMFKGVPLEAKSRAIVCTINRLLEAKEYLENLKKKDEIFLYEIVFVPSVVTYTEVNPNTFERFTLDPPMLTEAFWRISYATLNNEEALKA